MIFRWSPQQFAASLLVGSLVVLPSLSSDSAFAERRAPQIELESPSQTLDNTDEWTPVTEIDPSRGHGYLNMQVAAPVQEDFDEGPTLQGSVKEEHEFVPDVVFEETQTLTKGEKLILIVMDFVATGYSYNGDTFNARVKEAVERNGKVLVPKGALVKGHVASTTDPGLNFAKRGKIELVFDYILMPDGRKVPLKTQYTKGDTAIGAIARSIGTGLGATIGGTVKGLIVGLKYGGMGGAAATHGGTLIAGGAIGAASGLGDGIAQSGSHVMLNEGDEIKVALQEPLSLPSMILPADTVNEIHLDGLNVHITDYSLGRDPFKVEKMINLDIAIDNATEYKFGSFDMALVDEYNHTYHMSPFGENSSMLVFQVPAHAQFQGKASFSVQSPDLRHYLVFYKPYTHELVAKISLTEALKKLSTSKASKHSKSNAI